jgi:hypothetical protein
MDSAFPLMENALAMSSEFDMSKSNTLVCSKTLVRSFSATVPFSLHKGHGSDQCPLLSLFTASPGSPLTTNQRLKTHPAVIKLDSRTRLGLQTDQCLRHIRQQIGSPGH